MKYLPMKMEPIVSSETSAVKTQTPGNYPKRNKLQAYSCCACVMLGGENEHVILVLLPFLKGGKKYFFHDYRTAFVCCVCVCSGVRAFVTAFQFRNYRQCLLSFGAESFVFQVAIQTFKDQDI